MAMKRVAQHFEERLTQAWRGSDFPSQPDLARWLAGHRLDGRHEEGQTSAVKVYQHEGYRAVSCRVCQRPTIIGAQSVDDSCGRLSCDSGV